MRTSTFLLCVAWFFALFFITTPAYAQGSSVRMVRPNGGECLPGGTDNWDNILWDQSVAVDHFYIYFQVNDYEYFASDALAHPAGSFAKGRWFANPLDGQSYYAELLKIPEITTTNAYTVIEGHDYFHTVLFKDKSDTALAIDATAPSAPTLTLSNKTATSATLHWNLSTNEGCGGETKYEIWGSDEPIQESRRPNLLTSLLSPFGAAPSVKAKSGVTGQHFARNLSSNTSSHTLTGLKPGTTYTFWVVAYDTALSTRSNPISVTLPAASVTQTQTQPGVSGNSTGTQKTTKTTGPAVPSTHPLDFSVIKVDNQPLNVSSGEVSQLIAGQIIHIEGNASPRSEVTIHVFSQERVFKTASDEEGKWAYELQTNDLDSGDHRIEVRTKDKTGNQLTKEILRFSLISAAKAKENEVSGSDTVVVETKQSVSLLLLGAFAGILGLFLLSLLYRHKKHAPKHGIRFVKMPIASHHKIHHS